MVEEDARGLLDQELGSRGCAPATDEVWTLVWQVWASTVLSMKQSLLSISMHRRKLSAVARL
jgi:hypothetical protein